MMWFAGGASESDASWLPNCVITEFNGAAAERDSSADVTPKAPEANEIEQPITNAVVLRKRVLSAASHTK